MNLDQVYEEVLIFMEQCVNFLSEQVPPPRRIPYKDHSILSLRKITFDLRLKMTVN